MERPRRLRRLRRARAPDLLSCASKMERRGHGGRGMKSGMLSRKGIGAVPLILALVVVIAGAFLLYRN